MNNTKQWQKAFFSAFVMWTILITSLPLWSQDIVTSEDFSSGSSVFVFRQSRKTAQFKTSFRNTVVRAPSARRPSPSRNKQRELAIAAARAQRKQRQNINPNVTASNKTPAVDNKAGAGVNTTPVKTATKEQTSITLAGAAENYLDKNDVAKALVFFQKAVELDPNNDNAKLGLSEVLTRKGDEALAAKDAGAAVAFFDQAVKYNNQNAPAYAGLGEASEANGAQEKAIESYEKALLLNASLTELHAPLGALYYQKGEIAKADAYLTKAAAQNPSDIETKFYLGMIRYKQNRNEEAFEAFKQTLTLNRDSAEAHYYLGETYDRLNRPAEAFAEYKEAVRLNGNYLEAWFDLGVAHFNRGNYEEAVVAYKNVLRLKGNYGQAHANLAETYRQMAMDAAEPQKKQEYYNLANGSYSVASAFIKDDPELFSNWGFCLGRVARWETAIERLKSAVAIKPDAADYSNIGWAYQNAGLLDLKANRIAEGKAKLENGKIALQTALSMRPKFFAAFQNLGSVLLDLGDNQGAVNALKNAAELRKDFFPTVFSLAIAYRGLNDLDNAAKQFKKVTELDGKFARGWYSLGEIEYRRGNIKEARKAQDKLREINPGLADQLNVILSGAVFQGPQKKVEDKIQEKNPLKKIPKLPY